MTARDVRSPDGRMWRIGVDRDKLSLAEARREPFFKWHVVVTILVLLALLYVVVADQTHLGLIYVPIGLAIWFVGWILVTTRPIIRAALMVAARSVFSGVSPASTIIASSIWLDAPIATPKKPLSVPITTGMFASKARLTLARSVAR